MFLFDLGSLGGSPLTQKLSAHEVSCLHLKQPVRLWRRTFRGRTTGLFLSLLGLLEAGCLASNTAAGTNTSLVFHPVCRGPVSLASPYPSERLHYSTFGESKDTPPYSLLTPRLR